MRCRLYQCINLSILFYVPRYSRVGRLVDSPPSVHDGYVTIAENGSFVPTSKSSTPTTSVVPSTSSGSERSRSDKSGTGSLSYVILPSLAMSVNNSRNMNGSTGSKNSNALKVINNNIGPSKPLYVLNSFSETNGSIVQVPKYIERLVLIIDYVKKGNSIFYAWPLFLRKVENV